MSVNVCKERLGVFCILNIIIPRLVCSLTDIFINDCLIPLFHMKLDNTDVRILKVLQENGRLSFRQIADRVKVSVPTVSSKVGTMENMGIIKGTPRPSTLRNWAASALS